MGEYWKPVNLTRREYMHPHRLDCGLKLQEWNHPGSSVRSRMDQLWDMEHEDVRAVSDYGSEEQLSLACDTSATAPEFGDLDAEGYRDVSRAASVAPLDASTPALRSSDEDASALPASHRDGPACADHGGRGPTLRCQHCEADAAEAAEELRDAEAQESARLTRAAALLAEAVDLLAGDAQADAQAVLDRVTRRLKAGQ